ncbi:MAG: molybdenum cofactor guanylyltransferase [Myxococcales bacterium]|nr:molybdenum cofactor guanylyltransferase [Myxococcales bacterium]
MLTGVAAAILAGGRATRMGGLAKSFLEVDGRRIIDRQLDVLRPLFGELLIVAHSPAEYREFGLPIVGDAPGPGAGEGPLAGILAALLAARAERVVVLACDMPFLDARALRLVAEGAKSAVDAASPDATDAAVDAASPDDADLVVPVIDGRFEPLFARYARTCVPAIRARLAAGERKVTSFYADLRVHRLDEATLRALDPDLRFLANCNSPADLR